MAKILIVDDRLVNRDLLRVLLESAGHTLVCAPDGMEGLRLALQEPPELIISDIVMPLLDGYGFIRLLRAEPSIAHTKVILTSALASLVDVRVFAAAHGVVAVLNLPITPEEILECVGQVLDAGQIGAATAPAAG